MPRKPRVILDNTVSRKPKETIVKIEEETPVYLSQNFEPPADLNEKELKVWKWLVKIFRETVGCRVSDADIHLMQIYCRAKVAADDADASIKANPREYVIVPLGVDKDGKAKTTAKPNPAYKIRKENSELCIKLFDQLGLSPLARARVGLKAANARKEEDLFELLNKRSDE